MSYQTTSASTSLSLYSTISPRRRRGGTSPPLISIEKNPGPRKLGRRKLAHELPKNQHKDRQKKLGDIEKGEILMGIKIKFSNKEIGRRVGCSPATVRLWRERYSTTGEMKRLQGSGRKRKISEKEERYVTRLSLKDRKLTAVDLSREFIGTDGRLRVSVSTIRRTLQRRGLFGRVARKKPLLTFLHRQNRIRWAKDHKDWGVDKWKKVVWSDEATFRLFPTSGKVYIRRGKGEEYKPACITSISIFYHILSYFIIFYHILS